MESYVRIPVYEERQNLLTLMSSQSAIAQWLKLQNYRELVPLIEQGCPQPLVKTLALLGPH